MMLCRIVRTKDGPVLEIDPTRVETAGGMSIVRLANMEPAVLMMDLAELFRADRFEKEATPRHAPHHD